MGGGQPVASVAAFAERTDPGVRPEEGPGGTN